MSQLSIKHFHCPHCGEKHFSKRGHFYKKSTKTYIPRYHCHSCKKSFSTRTLSPTFLQKRTDLNPQVFKLLCAGVSMRETARVLNCTYKTVYRKFLWLGKRAKETHFKQKFNIQEFQFDEQETLEHTKLKPLSIALAVSDDYKILGVEIAQIPAKGHLASISRRKYGPRKNETSEKLHSLLSNLKAQLTNDCKKIISDAKPLYRDQVRKVFSDVPHEIYKSAINKEKRREQKYLKAEKHIHDPLFAVNHMCARLRDHIKRLARRSWCTTKKPAHLELALYLYIAKTNQYRFL